MEPFTHALTSVALARAGQRRLPRFGMAMLIASGIAPDLDYASYFGGSSSFLQLHRAAFHSLAGAALATCAVAGLFRVLDRKIPQKAMARRRYDPLSFGAAAAACGAGFAGHIALDLVSGAGVRLLWPFYPGWFGAPLTTDLDLWLLVLLVATLLVPMLFGLITEEVASKRGKGSARGGIVTLALVAAYLAGRADLRAQATDALLAREYHGRVPLSAAAFPMSSQPFRWRGVAVTDATIEEALVPVGPGADFDTDRSVTRFKPPDSPALDAAQATATAQRFLQYARVPLASIETKDYGYLVEIHDVRFAEGDLQPANIFARIELNANAQVKREELRFAASPNP